MTYLIKQIWSAGCNFPLLPPLQSQTSEAHWEPSVEWPYESMDDGTIRWRTERQNRVQLRGKGSQDFYWTANGASELLVTIRVREILDRENLSAFEYQAVEVTRVGVGQTKPELWHVFPTAELTVDMDRTYMKIPPPEDLQRARVEREPTGIFLRESEVDDVMASLPESTTLHTVFLWQDFDQLGAANPTLAAQLIQVCALLPQARYESYCKEEVLNVFQVEDFDRVAARLQAIR